MKRIRILLADGHYISRQGLKTIFGSDEGLEVVAEAETSAELHQFHNDLVPDAVVIDYTTPGFGLNDIKQIKANRPSLAFVAVTEFTHKEQVREAMRMGVDAHIQKDCSHDEIIDSVKAAYGKERFFCGKVLDVIGEDGEHEDFVSCEPVSLSLREIEIIQQVAAGQTNKQIADSLHLSAHTVMTHRKNIMNKLGINNTAGLVIYAVKENLISPNKFLFNQEM